MVKTELRWKFLLAPLSALTAFHTQVSLVSILLLLMSRLMRLKLEHSLVVSMLYLNLVPSSH